MSEVPLQEDTTEGRRANDGAERENWARHKRILAAFFCAKFPDQTNWRVQQYPKTDEPAMKIREKIGLAIQKKWLHFRARFPDQHLCNWEHKMYQNVCHGTHPKADVEVMTTMACRTSMTDISGATTVSSLSCSTPRFEQLGPFGGPRVGRQFLMSEVPL